MGRTTQKEMISVQMEEWSIYKKTNNTMFISPVVKHV